MSSGPETAAQHTVPQRIDRIKAVPVRHPGRWIGVVVIAVIVALIGQSVATNENFRWDIVWLYLRDVKIIQGVGWTLLLTVASMVLAIVLAILLAFMRQSDNPIFRWVSWFWVWFFRGTPVYTQLIFWGLFAVLYPKIAIGIPWGPELFSFNTQDYITGFLAALLGLGLNESAYLAEIFRAGLKSVDKGQIEAAEALGIRKAKVMWRIVLPQAMRIIVPPTGNETIGMLKTTSLVLAVPFTLELTFASNALANKTYLPIPFLLIAAFWYLLITSILMVGQHYIERYYGKGVDNLSPAPLRAPEQNV
ncbi:amino acid ABC transporter permease [Arthrobacter russicus]|jgi:polar amino acid transport system permease protein|uniref:Polar amino acid transport system permease protein n=1 Tax=Arthrobacter russicus TaxID=172040 RepID=A0ABU1JCT8_9MICC|nr:amino acid ABC transporter permease [Arthrobacter russicus]MBQ1442964.1 amino acid ABC transporter permease [Renibacterium sp.]MDN5667103.1 amino acid ABC transporter permease [Renibacterium salmoninarum]MDR6270248.1 polar amino acid transport system permease protein [Arthrobacter russicus]